jgi:hypothetical protein
MALGDTRGGNQRGTLSLTHGGEPTIRLKHIGGAIVNERPFMAALAVANNGARVIGSDGKPITPATVVVCRKAFGSDNTLSQSRIGVPIQAIDPGKGHELYVLPWSTTSAPTIAKTQCRDIGECKDFTDKCVGCHNFQKYKKRK